MYSLPTTVTVKDRQFHITAKGDFRMVLDCFGALNDTEIGEDSRVLASLIIFYEELTFENINDFNDYLIELFSEMCVFINCGQQDSPGAVTKTSLIDWEKDTQIICAAINNVAKTEIRALDYLHWWTFMGYYLSVGESILSTVVSIRNKIVKGEKLDKWEQKFRRNNPNYFDWQTNTEIDGQDLEAFLDSLRDGGEPTNEY